MHVEGAEANHSEFAQLGTGAVHTVDRVKAQVGPEFVGSIHVSQMGGLPEVLTHDEQAGGHRVHSFESRT